MNCTMMSLSMMSLAVMSLSMMSLSMMSLSMMSLAVTHTEALLMYTTVRRTLRLILSVVVVVVSK